MEAVEPRVTEEMNAILTEDLTVDEIMSAVQNMHPTKALGQNSMPALFYQKFRNIIGNDIIDLCFSVLNGHSQLSDINKTHLVLIPKLKEPCLISQFRPISLCNVVYKIIAKVLANRLNIILPRCISNTQSAFVPGRLITDNALVAFEMFHTLKRKKKRKWGFYALKLDMEKAYDRVEWPFLQAVMNRMGFHLKWINMIMRCITLVSCSIVINGCVSNSFQPERGFRQGGPLSPYLFLICTKGLSALLFKHQRQGTLKGDSG